MTKVLERDWGWDTPGYLGLIDEAKANGIKILSVDKKFPKAMCDAWAKDGKYDEESQLREKQWAQVIGDQLAKEPDSRVFMLAGKAHVGIEPKRTQSLTYLLEQKQLKPLVIVLDSPAHVVGDGNFYTQTVRQAGLDNERFAVPIVKSGFRPSDFIVNLPARQGSSTFSDPMLQMEKILRTPLAARVS